MHNLDLMINAAEEMEAELSLCFQAGATKRQCTGPRHHRPSLKGAVSNVAMVVRVQLINEWISGFIDGEGRFNIEKIKNIKGGLEGEKNRCCQCYHRSRWQRQGW